MSLSDEYYKALAAATKHHELSKTYSGKLLRPHAPFIKQIIDRLSVQSILDYGCGKGAQYEWVSQGGTDSIPKGMTIEQYWGMPVTKYDPAVLAFNRYPMGPFDLVICTHTLGAIPVLDRPYIVEALYGLSRKALYVAEKIGAIKKQVYSSESLVSNTREYWETLLLQNKHEKIECTLSTRHPSEKEVVTLREVLR